jgi:A/G-specific adenine glycosylase
MKKRVANTQLKKLSEALWSHYDRAGRHDLGWRKNPSPYRVVVSEVMLQQTQVVRVEEYFKNWLKQYPSWKALSEASLRDVLLSWQGLGYNRRGKYLHDIAQIVTCEHKGKLPSDRASLEALPGIGHYTAGSIRAFAFNELDVLLETNIRTVLFYHLYNYQKHSLKSVSDQELFVLLERLIASDTRAKENPRDFYYAMMDYGSHLKQTVGNLNQHSKSYVKQSKFEGSRRQLRATIVRQILAGEQVSKQELYSKLGKDKILIDELLAELVEEGQIRQHGNIYAV